MSAASPVDSNTHTQMARRAIWIMLAGIVAYDAFSWYLAVTTQAWQLFVVAGVVLAFGVADGVGLLLARRGRSAQGLWLTVVAFLLTDLVIGALVSGLGLSLGVIAPLLTAAMLARAVPPRQLRTGLLAGVVAGLVIAATDLVGGSYLTYRIAVPLLQIFTPIIAAVLLIIYGIYLVRVLADYSLRTRLILAFLAVAIIPLGVLATVDFRASQQALTDAANQALLGAAGQTALSIESFFFNVRYTLLAESQLPTVSSYLALPPAARAGSQLESDLTGIMQNWVLRDKRASAYLLLDSRGVVAISTASQDAGQDLSATSYFQQAMATGDTRVSDVLFPANSPAGEIDVSVAVRDQHLKFAGVLVARFSSRVLQDFVSQTNGLAGTHSYGVLVDENLQELADGGDQNAVGKFLTPPLPSNLAMLQSLGRAPQWPAGAASALNQPDLAWQLIGIANNPRLAASFFTVPGAGGDNQVAVTRLNTKPWLLAFFEPRDVFLAPVQSQTNTALALAALIAVVVTIGAVLSAQVLAAPLARLTSTAAQVAGGDLTVRAQITSHDETGTLARTFNLMTERLSEMVATLESRVAERTKQLQAAADIGRATASVRDLDELLRLALDLIRNRFGYYHASIFLIDELNRTAVLRESTGPVGEQLKARGHKLAIGSQSLIGWITANRKLRVALDVADDPFYFKNPLLPGTRSEAAIPLIVGDRLLGALDVQSTEANAFRPGDLQVLQTVADQLSIAIDNAALFQRTQASLDELNRLYQGITSATWRTLQRGEKREARYEAGGPSVLAARDSDNTLVGSRPLELPLQVRDRGVGVIEIYGRPAASWTDEERAALGTVAAQVSAALETAALLEETQRRRVREQMINDITYQMRATLNPAQVMQSGIRELGRALGATEVVVRLAQTPAGSASPAQDAAAPDVAAPEAAAPEAKP